MAEETLDLILSLRDEATSKLAAAGGQLASLNEQSTRAAATVQTLADKYRLAGQSQDLVAKSVTDLTGKQAKLESTIEATTRALEQERSKADSNATTIATLERSLEKLQQQARSTSDAIERKVISIEKASVSMRQLEQRTLTAADAMRHEDSAMSEAKGSMGGLADGLMGVAKAYVGVEAVRKAVQWGKEGAAIEGVEEAFENLARKSGMSSTTYLAALKDASAGTISETNLMIGANKAVLLAGDRLAKDVPQLLEIARAASKATGEDINFMFDSLVTGLARNSKMIIDNLGITVDVAKANETYAASIGKTADALNDQEKALAFQQAVMQSGQQMINDVGVDVDSNAAKIARAEAHLENFGNKLKVLAGDIVGFFAEGIDVLDRLTSQNFTVAQRLHEVDYLAIQSGKSFATYEQSLKDLDATEGMVTERQYHLAEAFLKTGMDAQTAMDRVRSLGDAFVRKAEAVGLSSTAIADLAVRADTLSEKSERARGAVEATTFAFSAGSIDATMYRDALDAIEQQVVQDELELTRLESATLLVADSTREATASTDEFTAAVEAHTDSLYAKIDATIEASMEQETLALLTQNARLAADDHIGALAAETGSLYDLAAAAQTAGDALAYKALMEGAAQLPRNTTAARNELRAEGIDPRDQRQYKDAVVDRSQDLVNPAGAAARQREAERQADDFNRQNADRIRTTRGTTRRSSGGGGSRGSGGSRSSGKTASEREAEQRIKQAEQTEAKIAKAKEDFQEKAERLTRDHHAAVRKIEDDYHRKALAAEQSFNRQKFAGQADFLESVAGMNKADRAEALRKQTEAWDKAQVMAQAGRAKEADAYLKAAEEEIEADQQRTDRMRQLRQQLSDDTAELTAADRADLEEQLRLLDKADQIKDDLAAKRLSDLETANDSLKAERDEALASENADYTEAQAKLRDDFADTMRGIVDKQTEQLHAHQTWADATIALYGLVASAASNAANAASRVPSGTSAPGDDAIYTTQDKVEASYALGTGDRGLARDMIVQAHAREIIVDPTRSDVIRKAGGIDYLIKLGETERVNRSRPDRLPTVTPAPLVQPAPRDYPPTAAAAGPTSVAIQAGGLTLAQVEALMRRILAQNNQGMGQQSQVRQRLASPRK
ncbi:coiled-coil domain-containing protein [Herpetosiphon geysericola]|uniref:Uncharacterized protein n=1 Tax=Herpetosiphon geysericola TaxID=70996 RepID=A0A0P6XJG4_9CHLR|nr:hypothetical protein [Herpetosiphon geysericola]KPL80278.1 hypothetical protein SE18_24835 [Herpetosiphon geysericola]